MPQSSPSLRDLVTILYQPGQTMRRVLDRGDRWTIQIVLLVLFCTSIGDTDIRRLSELLPGLTLLPVMAIVVGGLIVAAAAWVLGLFVVSWVVTGVGRALGGAGSADDVRAALGWGLVPLIWSVSYRVPMILLRSRYDLGREINTHQALFDFAEHGGCAIVVVIIALQFIFFVWCLFVTSFTLAEAQRFSPAKALGTLAIAVALPFLLTAAAVFAFF